jgi:Integrase core domain/GAG-pre-integrase domain
LYILKLNLVRLVCLKTSIKADSQLWHTRYGHINFQSLKKLSQGNMVEELLEIECKEGVCRGCMIGKQRRSPFPDETSFRANEVLELIHRDLCGLIKPTTPTGNKYFLLLVDDFSRYMWIQLMKTKDKAFSAFKEVKKAIEIERNVKVKGFRSDRGGEFRSVEFDEYCKLKRINRFLTAPYSPQQNGVTERRNQTILGMTQNMMKSKEIPSEFWGEAVTMAVYILNRAPTKSLDGITPYEAWSNRNPRVDHFRVFGSLVHVKVVNPQQSKLEDKSELMILFGYEKGSKAYRVYNPNTKRVHVTRDVVFEEDKKWDLKIEEDEHNFPTSIDFSVDQSELETKYQFGENEVRQQGSESPTVVPEFTESRVQDEFKHSEEESQGTPVRLRSLEEIYSETKPVQVNYTDTYLIRVKKPTNFADAVRNKN